MKVSNLIQHWANVFPGCDSIALLYMGWANGAYGSLSAACQDFNIESMVCPERRNEKKDRKLLY